MITDIGGYMAMKTIFKKEDGGYRLWVVYPSGEVFTSYELKATEDEAMEAVERYNKATEGVAWES